MYMTYQDCLPHLIDYLGGGLSDTVVRDCKRAILEAYRELGTAHNWTYLYNEGRFYTSPIVSDLTLSFQQSSGTYPNQFVLDDSTKSWPSWAKYGTIRIGTVNYKIVERKSNLIVTADPEIAPPADMPSSTGFVMYQDSYLLPADFIAQDQALYETNFGSMQYCRPRDWLYENRYRFAQGIPYAFTISGDPGFPGRLFCRIFPFPTEVKSIAFIYKRAPRPLNIFAYEAGTLACTAGSASVTLTGGTFSNAMIGSCIRISSTPAPPTSSVGNNPADTESIIHAIVNPQTAVIADPAMSTLATAKYAISDPLDLEVSSMLNCFLRNTEKHISMNRTLKDKPSAKLQYAEALEYAKAADSRSFAGDKAGPRLAYRQRMRDMPTGPDQP